MKSFLILSLSLLNLSAIAAPNSHIQYREISDKLDVFKFLFRKHDILLNPDCHRNVFEGRAAKVYVAMGCKIIKLEIDKSHVKETMVQTKATYDCDGQIYPLTAHCELRK